MHENGNKIQINIFCEPYYKAVIFYKVSYLQISSKWYISTVMSLFQSIMISWLPVTSFTRVHIAMKLKMLHWENFVSHPTNPISVHFHFSTSSLLFPANTHIPLCYWRLRAVIPAWTAYVPPRGAAAACSGSSFAAGCSRCCSAEGQMRQTMMMEGKLAIMLQIPCSKEFEKSSP